MSKPVPATPSPACTALAPVYVEATRVATYRAALNRLDRARAASDLDADALATLEHLARVWGAL